jgi:hypothetical protein
MLRVPDGVELVSDPSAGKWLVERLRPSGEEDHLRVASFVPAGFESYVQVLHPARQYAPPEAGEAPPEEGSLPSKELQVLAALLEPFTSAPDLCWFCIWEGFGFWWSHGHSRIYLPGTDAREIASDRRDDERQDEILRGIPRVEMENRAYFLFRGPLSKADSFNRFEPWFQSPNLWWPNDRAWCVATEIDFSWTYVGASSGCVDRVLAAPELETTTVSADTAID